MQTRSQTRAFMKNNNMKFSIEFDTNFINSELDKTPIKTIIKKPSLKYLPVNIDFDGASRAWKKNKIYIGNGCYKYK